MNSKTKHRRLIKHYQRNNIKQNKKPVYHLHRQIFAQFRFSKKPSDFGEASFYQQNKLYLYIQKTNLSNKQKTEESAIDKRESRTICTMLNRK